MPYSAIVMGLSSLFMLSIAAVILTLLLMIRDINTSPRGSRIERKQRYSAREVREIKRIHGELYPRSRKVAIYDQMFRVTFAVVALSISSVLAYVLFIKITASH